MNRFLFIACAFFMQSVFGTGLLHKVVNTQVLRDMHGQQEWRLHDPENMVALQLAAPVLKYEAEHKFPGKVQEGFSYKQLRRSIAQLAVGGGCLYVAYKLLVDGIHESYIPNLKMLVETTLSYDKALGSVATNVTSKIGPYDLVNVLVGATGVTFSALGLATGYKGGEGVVDCALHTKRYRDKIATNLKLLQILRDHDCSDSDVKNAPVGCDAKEGSDTSSCVASNGKDESDEGADSCSDSNEDCGDRIIPTHVSTEVINGKVSEVIRDSQGRVMGVFS